MDTKKYFELLQIRNKLLQQKPHLKKLQDEVDRKLKGAETSDNRMAIIGSMMEDSVKELSEAYNVLLEELIKQLNSKKK